MSGVFSGKSIILGVCGGIAAYKSAELIRLLKKNGAEVRVIATRNAFHFIGRHTLQALSDNPVLADLFDGGPDASIKHIEWAQEADLIILAPATANIIGKFANGIADDALSTLLLAAFCPVIICPSMNTKMYENAATQRNLKRLASDGHYIMTPGAGELACGTSGAGRLPEPGEIIDYAVDVFTPKTLSGKRILVTGGPTLEPIDPVRFISNPSSGKMGVAIARAAAHRGAEVILVLGPSSIPNPSEKNISVIRIKTAVEMRQAVLDHFDSIDIVVKAAAVGDYRPDSPSEHKIKKIENQLTLVLEKNPDILLELGKLKTRQILIGFAAETQSLEKYAAAKMNQKNLDIIVGNIVGRKFSGFASDTNQVVFFYRDGTRETPPLMEKYELAHLLFDRIEHRFLSS